LSVHVPAGAVDEESGVRIERDVLSDLGKQQIHREGVAGGQDERRAFCPSLGQMAPKILGRGGALIFFRRASALNPRFAIGGLILFF